jgi:hypothetical protein
MNLLETNFASVLHPYIGKSVDDSLKQSLFKTTLHTITLCSKSATSDVAEIQNQLDELEVTTLEERTRFFTPISSIGLENYCVP